jgi:peptide/nickel transport system permease protein
LPGELEGKKIAYAVAGKDHIIAITTEGKVVGWGKNDLAQYGNIGLVDSSKLYEPDELINGTIDVNNIKSVTAGNQATAIVMNDGSFYIWGNKNSTNNIIEIYEWQKELNEAGKSANVEKIVFGSTYAICLLKDGTIKTGDRLILGTKEIASYGKKIVDIASDSYSVGAVFEDGTVMVTGVIEYNQSDIPELEDGEKFVSISAGTRHYVGITDKNNAYTWGSNFYKQAKYTKLSNVTEAFAVSNQTYYLNGDKVIKSAGLKGFIMGTDGSGRDLFARIVHGGKMTMTIGAVAVIISTIIAIIVGCLSGYFGKWVDMLLMRVTEVFSALPFLPFAMMLSVVISNYNISENKRIFIIMVILGLLSWTGLAHMIRGQVLAEREKEFVIAAKAMGVKESKIAFKHILPNVVSIILVSVTLDFAGCMLTESSLSYLGFGVQQPQPTWGNLLNGANNSVVIKYYWWQWLFPALFLGIATICINIIGDGLRDVLDPKSSNDR